MDVFEFHDAGHRDQHIQLGEPGKYVGRSGGDRVGVGGVDDHPLDTGVFGGDFVKQFGAPPATLTPPACDFIEHVRPGAA